MLPLKVQRDLNKTGVSRNKNQTHRANEEVKDSPHEWIPSSTNAVLMSNSASGPEVETLSLFLDGFTHHRLHNRVQTGLRTQPPECRGCGHELPRQALISAPKALPSFQERERNCAGETILASAGAEQPKQSEGSSLTWGPHSFVCPGRVIARQVFPGVCSFGCGKEQP